MSPRVDPRKVSANSRYWKAKVAKFAPVLEGRAQVVKVPKAQRDKLPESFARSRGRVAVPVSKGEHVGVTKKGEVTKTRTVNGKKTRSTFHDGKFETALKLREGKNLRYRMPFANGMVMTFDTKQDLLTFMAPYETKKNPYKNWQAYVEVVRIGEDDGDEE